MAKVYLGLGSNVDPIDHLRLGIQELGRRFGVLELSNLYQNASVGFDGDDFINLVVALESDVSPLEIHNNIDEIHAIANRQGGESRFAPRTLDIDLLLYDDLVLNEPPILVPRADILKYSFVLGPLAEIAPDLRHPQTGRSIADHWAEYDKGGHPLLSTSIKL
jgi:2-amino-4-hydroxy-6-hydroxymethyldihydropteridine diphosphokinase